MVSPEFEMEPDATGLAEEEGVEAGPYDGFQQPTAMFDRGEFLGELAELQQEAPETRAHIEAELPPRGFRMIVVAGPDLGVEWSFKKPSIVIGRGSDCDIELVDIAVSREHAKINLVGANFVLEDLGSNNGTCLNGVRVKTENLSPGDEILIGARTFRFVELTEAPETRAAHPIRAPAPEPVVGHVSEIVPTTKDVGPGRASKVDIAALPPEPAVGDGPPATPVSFGPRPRGVGLRLAGMFLVVAVAVGGVAWLLVHRHRKLAEEAEVARVESGRRSFLQGVELVKTRRFGDAIIMFDAALGVRPGYHRALEYKTHSEKEVTAWRALEEAKRLARERRPFDAIELLDSIDSESAWASDALRLKNKWILEIAEAKIADAVVLLAQGDRDGAMDLLREALKLVPGLMSALALEARIVSETKEADAKKGKKKEDPIPPLMMRAVALYREDKVTEAIDAAEAAGGPDAAIYQDRMRDVQENLAEIEAAHRQKAAAEILRLAPKTLDLDRKIARGDGRVRRRLKDLYADALYLKGLESYNEQDFEKAFRLLSDALDQAPGHQLSESRLAELSRRARDLYYQGYVLKDTNTPETKKIFRRVTQMTRSGNQYHQLASKWLAQHGG